MMSKKKSLMFPANKIYEFDKAFDEFLAVWQAIGVDEIIKCPPSKTNPMCYISWGMSPSSTNNPEALRAFEESLKEQEQALKEQEDRSDDNQIPVETTPTSPLNEPSSEGIVCTKPEDVNTTEVCPPKLEGSTKPEDDNGTGVGEIPKLEEESDEDSDEDDDDEDEEEEEEKFHQPAYSDTSESPTRPPGTYWSQEDLNEIIRLTRLNPHYAHGNGLAQKCLPKDLQTPTTCAFCEKRLDANALAQLWKMQDIPDDDDILYRKYDFHHTCAWKKYQINKIESRRFRPFK